MRFFLAAQLVCALMVGSLRAGELETGWTNPPTNARLRAYWWWLNGNVTKQSITRDLEQMKAKGFGGALICDADGSSQDGNDRAPHGPTFFSPAWRELYKHTLREASRLGLEMSLNIQSGWNLGGPMVTAADAPKKMVWTETTVQGGPNVTVTLEKPQGRDDFYRDLYVLAYPVNKQLSPDRKPLQNQKQKALLASLVPFSAPDSAPLFQEYPSTIGEEDTRDAAVADLTPKMDTNGVLRTQLPGGEWMVIRFGYTLNDHCRVSTCSEGWDGYAIDPFDGNAFKRYWNAVVEPLIADAGPLAGKTLKYLTTDSWEVEVASWTPTLRAEFEKRRGYDLLAWLPVIAGKIVNNRMESDRFLNDFRRTMGDLAVDNHYKLFKEGAHKHGLQIHPESGGPHSVPIDAQQCLGFNDAPMSEFWAWSWRHRIGDDNRFFVKQPASAAHTYGRKLVLAEGFTTIGPHWQETLWDNLKPAFDHACTEGLNLLVWHAFVCSPTSEGIPGQQYFAGTHLNPNVTWWEKSKPFFDYINRCQFLLQRGLPVADVAYYYGGHVPNFTQHRGTDPARVGDGYDYDVVTDEVILNRMSVKNGRLVLPEGTSYRLLVLPQRDSISLPVLRKLKEFADAGIIIIGPKPETALTLKDYAQADVEVVTLTTQMWGGKGGTRKVVDDKTAREVLNASGVKPDFQFTSDTKEADINFIHRRDGGTDIYFVANRTNLAVTADCAFRVSGKAPELWNAVTGEHKFATAYEEKDGTTVVPLDFTPCGSWFVIFREPTAQHPAVAKRNQLLHRTLFDYSGGWTVRFDPKWGGLNSVAFEKLQSWTERAELGIKYFSGTAVYEKSITIPSLVAQRELYLDLGEVHEIAEVRLNGKSCGIVWAPPFRVNISDAARAGVNKLEVEVVNFWPNRVIGDASLPPAEQRTKTNIRKLTADVPLMESGLIGPVTLTTPPTDKLSAADGTIQRSN